MLYVLNTGFDSLGKADHLFLSLDGSDPSKELVEELRESGVNIHPVSKSKYDDTYGTVAHISKLGSAAIIQIRGIKIISQRKVKVDWGHYKGNVNASGSTATARMKNGRWLVTKSRMKWIS
ncbi:hypothetical protein GCM10008090_23190 [Arenicella chitinivorans]|uniref:Uncharacterized protein n=1 Tax=Arenicella chitinivorans TaxID=1329800 RepID=A0A918RVS1_9GAMM|nr:hypothetical protein GCM10008090_23190 [Arenicella chitinivorans]